jgi:hypothetical protein
LEVNMGRRFFKLIFVLAASIALTSSFGPAYAEGPAGDFFQPYYPSSHYYASTPPTYDALTNYDAFPPLIYDAPMNYYAPPSYPPAAVYGWILVRPTSCGNYRYWNGEYCADARNGLPYVGPKW